jgi:hypothetical protein
VGLFIAVFNSTWVFDLVFDRQIDPVFWTDGIKADGSRSFKAWIYGVLGATDAGWGVFIVFLARFPFRRRERWSWNCICAGFTLWYVVDTALSVSHGVLFNAFFNTLLAVLVMLPLFATRRQFRD